MRDELWKEDTATRQQLLQKWRRLKFFWNNITNVWYDSVAHDWRIWNQENNGSDNDQAYYDQRINVFRAYLESIFAALSIVVPPVKAVPDDATNSDDIETAKAADKISSLIYKHNEAPMLWLHNLYIWGTEGLVCGYNYPSFKKEYGEYQVDEYKNESEFHVITTCPLCNFELEDEIVDEKTVNQVNEIVVQQEATTGVSDQEELQEGQVIPSTDPTMMGSSGGLEICPSCNSPMTPKIEALEKIVPKLVNTVDTPKGRICLESYGGLNCKVPLYARKQDEVFYLFYCFEEHWAQSIEKYPDLYEKLRSQQNNNSAGSFDSYEQWARLSTEYRGEYPVNVVTNKSVWFKCAAYNVLDVNRAKHWKKKYPEGIRATFINDLFAEAKAEALDDYWTLEYNPMADYMSNDPIGSLLTSVQEITNDLISLQKQTLEHSVGLTIADPAFLDLNAFQQSEVVPGAVIPSKQISGNKKLQDGFMELKTSQFSGDSLVFGENIQSLGQLASGAMPALFGQMDSETASQDSMSKNQAQSRLGLQWKTKCIWWKNYIGKAINMYIVLLSQKDYPDETRDVKREIDGSFINIVIKKQELSGKIGRIELESNENLPLSWSQRKDVIMQLILSPNPSIIQMLMQPENLPVLREAIGLDNFYVPGADDVDKQWNEIAMLISSDPIETMDEMVPMAPSVEIDVLMDTHPIHFEICRKWAVSEVGQYYKYNMPAQYQNVLLHAKQHLDAQNVGPMLGEGQDNGANPENPKELNNKDAPITGDVDVPANV